MSDITKEFVVAVIQLAVARSQADIDEFDDADARATVWLAENDPQALHHGIAGDCIMACVNDAGLVYDVCTCS